MKINDKEFNYSFSQNRLYNDCPMKYKFRYIDGIKEPSNPNLDLGSAIHKVLELWNEYDEFIDLSNSYDEYYNMTKDFQNVSEETYNYKLLTHKYLCEAQNYISERLGKMYFERLMINIDKIKGINAILGQELEIKKDDFIGYIDLLMQDEFEDKGKIIIADYKVTKKPKTVDSIFEEGQLLIYKYIYCTENNIDPKNVDVAYINIKPFFDSRIVNKVQYNPSMHDCEVEWNRVQETKQKILSGEFPKRKKWCNWCFYKDMCDNI